MSIDNLKTVLNKDIYYGNQGFEERIDPKYYPLIVLDNISVYEKKRLEIDKKLLEVCLQNQFLFKDILNELKDEADEGQVLDINGSVSQSAFTFIETAKNPEHPIKAFDLTNDGPNPISFAWNVIQQGLEPSSEDVNSSLTRFRTLAPGDNVRFSFNRRVIKNIALLAIGGDSTFKIWLIW